MATQTANTKQPVREKTGTTYRLYPETQETVNQICAEKNLDLADLMEQLVKEHEGLTTPEGRKENAKRLLAQFLARMEKQAVAYAAAIGAEYDSPIKSAKATAASLAKATKELAAATKRVAELEAIAAESTTEAQTRARALIDRIDERGVDYYDASLYRLTEKGEPLYVAPDDFATQRDMAIAVCAVEAYRKGRLDEVVKSIRAQLNQRGADCYDVKPMIYAVADDGKTLLRNASGKLVPARYWRTVFAAIEEYRERLRVNARAKAKREKAKSEAERKRQAQSAALHEAGNVGTKTHDEG